MSSEKKRRAPRPRPRICLAGSGGGHVRQLLDLEPVWRDESCFFVTEDTALGRSLARKHDVRLVDHFAAGQLRLGQPLRMLVHAIANLAKSWGIIRDEQPDLVITTGAGAMFWVTLLARLRGARIILIDSFARFRGPSLFARIVRPLAHRTVVQSPLLKQRWPDAELFDPLQVVDRDARLAKEPLIFATVGATLPFPRLVDAVLGLDVAHHVLLQIGEDRRPDIAANGAEIVPALDFTAILTLLQRADIVICHGGTGSILTALAAGCHVIVMPRRHDLGEHYDNHQEEIAAAFAQRGLIMVAHDAASLSQCVAACAGRPRVIARAEPTALAHWLETQIRTLALMPPS